MLVDHGILEGRGGRGRSDDRLRRLLCRHSKLCLSFNHANVFPAGNKVFVLAIKIMFSYLERC